MHEIIIYFIATSIHCQTHNIINDLPLLQITHMLFQALDNYIYIYIYIYCAFVISNNNFSIGQHYLFAFNIIHWYIK